MKTLLILAFASGFATAAESTLDTAIDDYLASAPARPAAGLSQIVSAAEPDTDDLAKKTQNPVSDLISLPFQFNAGFEYGKDDDVQLVVNIQPVIPVKLNESWNLITRTVVPVIYQPAPVSGTSDDFGLGDTTFTAFFSPREPGKFIWGAGPVILIPTSTGDTLGAGEWGVGASGVALKMKGPWVFGALISNVWSFEGAVNSFLFQPFVNYNMPGGWYLVSAPVVTANWEAASGEEWTVPIGGGVGRITRIGKQPINVQVQVFYHLENPTIGPEWSFRFQIQFLFPQ